MCSGCIPDMKVNKCLLTEKLSCIYIIWYKFKRGFLAALQNFPNFLFNLCNYEVCSHVLCSKQHIFHSLFALLFFCNFSFSCPFNYFSWVNDSSLLSICLHLPINQTNCLAAHVSVNCPFTICRFTVYWFLSFSIVLVNTYLYQHIP